jgi:homoserine O-acetyltransferase/O-succinyltransferase
MTIGEALMRLWQIPSIIALSAVLTASPALAATGAAPPTIEGDFVIHDFHFASGETLPELRMHYITMGTLRRDAHGKADNAVLILHGTGASARSLLNEHFSGVLFGRGQLLDTERYYIVLPDGIGHGNSSRPSDGLHGRFPQYGYADMVAAQYALLTAGLQVDHLRLVLGASMGGMHTIMWGETYAGFADALLPLACLPAQIAGRNRLWRNLIIQAIRNDPEWRQGEYSSEPMAALHTAAGLLLLAASAPIQLQLTLPTRDAADQFLDTFMKRESDELDANDLLYQMNASRDYDPEPGLEKIAVPLTLINSADDFVNPPELGLAERGIKRMKSARYVLLPASDQTHGHGTYVRAALWQPYLEQLLRASQP